MIALIAVSLGLLVIVAGMFLLTKTQKDGLGKIFHFVSYATVAFGLLIFACAIIISLGKMMCHACGHDHPDCRGAGMSLCSHDGGHGGHMGMHRNCHMGMMKCGKEGSQHHMGCCKKGDKCEKKMKCGKGEGKEMMSCKKIIKTEESDTGSEADKEIEVEASSN